MNLTIDELEKKIIELEKRIKALEDSALILPGFKKEDEK